MTLDLLILIIGIGLVVFFDFTNGFHDAADMIATALASRSMPPWAGILIVSVFTFLGPLLGGVAVANTIGEFVVIDPANAQIAQKIAISGVMAAIIYNLVTWKLGLPSSSSNSLTSGLIGAGLVALGSDSIQWGFAELPHGEIKGFLKIVTGMILSPLFGLIAGFLIIRLLRKVFRRVTIRAKQPLIIFQYFTVAWLAFSHGANDAQKGMGVIAMLLLASGVYTEFTVPFWVILLCASSITVGTMLGGWGIIKTMGFGIYRIRLVHSVGNQIASGAVILASALFGAPVSTTQVVTTTLVGIGAGEHPRHVRWGKVKGILIGWLVNIPISLVLGGIICFLLLKTL